MYLLEFLVPPGQLQHPGLQLFELVGHESLFGLEVHLLLTEFFEVDEVFFDEDGVAVVDGGLPLLEDAVVDLMGEQFLLELLVLLELVHEFGLVLDLGVHRLALLVLAVVELLGGQDGAVFVAHSIVLMPAVAVAAAVLELLGVLLLPVVLQQQQQPFVFVAEVLDLYLHFVDLGGVDVLLVGLDGAVLLCDFEVELLNNLLEAHHQRVVALLYVVLMDQLLHLPVHDHSNSKIIIPKNSTLALPESWSTVYLGSRFCYF